MIDETGEGLGSSTGTGARTADTDVGASAESGIKSTRDVLKAGTNEAMRDAKSMIRDVAEEQKSRAADSLEGVAQALHEAARNLGDNQTTARYADIAADQVERVSQMLRNKDWSALIDNAENFARRNPAVFVGGAMAAGFMLARFMKSGRSQSYGARPRSGYAGTAYSQQGYAGEGGYASTGGAYSTASTAPRTYVPPESGEFREPGTAARDVFGGREPGIDSPAASGASSTSASASTSATSTTTPRSASEVRGGDI